MGRQLVKENHGRFLCTAWGVLVGVKKSSREYKVFQRSNYGGFVSENRGFLRAKPYKAGRKKLRENGGSGLE